MNNILSIKQVIELPINTKVYRVWNGSIKMMRVLVKHPSTDIFYFISEYNVKDTFSTYIPHDSYPYFTDYSSAKEEMWKQAVERLESVNHIYFDNAKVFTHE